MKTVKVSKATEIQLDWLVAEAEGILKAIHGESAPRVVLYMDNWQIYMRFNPPPQVYYSDRYSPSNDWSLIGPIIDREGIRLDPPRSIALWGAEKNGYTAFGPTPLIAAARCYVTSKLGEEVQVPDEL